MSHIVKRKGHTEVFDAKKIYASVFASCKTLRMTDEQAELIAVTVTKEVVNLFKDSPELTAHTIHKVVADSIKKYNPDAAYMYDTHRDIS